LARQKQRSLRRRGTATTGKAGFSASRLLEDVDTYVDAIYAVIALINHARWDDDAKKMRPEVKYGIGRRFLTSASHSTPTTEVTPDGAVQFSPARGMIAEAKPGVARAKAVWLKNLDQLKKYDDDLSGWWTADGKVTAHDIVALIPLPRAADFIDLVQGELKRGAITFTRPLSIVAFVKNTGAETTWVILQTQPAAFGQISDPVLREKLRRAVPIDWQVILVHYNDPRFIDAEPPLAYTLYILWDYLFSKMASGRQAEPGEKWIGIDVNLEALTAEVQTYYGFKSDGPGAVDVPRQRWIRRALDALVAVGMAVRVTDNDYLVKYRRYRTKDGDTVTFFGRKLFQNRERLERAQTEKPLLVLSEQPTPPPTAPARH
jgi:hypothetical protein